MQEAEKYVALCFGLHRIAHDKATNMEQNRDKRYINARAHTYLSVYLRKIVNYQIWK